MAKQTVAEWIRDGYEKYGRAYVMNGRLKARDDVGHEYNEQNWNREVRRQINRVNGDDESVPDESFNVQTLDDSQKFHDINEEIFNVKKLVTNTWGGPQNPNQQVKVEYERKMEDLCPEKWAEAFHEALGYDFKPKSVKSHNRKADLTAQISMPDMHIGQLVWEESIGTTGAEYDVEQACKLYLSTAKYLSADLNKNSVKKILLPWGEDAFNVDGMQGTTTKGTPQMNEDPKKAIARGLAVSFQVIEQLAELADVHVPIICGNHDTLTSYMAGLAIEQRFRNDKRVTVDAGPGINKAYGSGNWGVVWQHGKKKAADMAWVFPNEYPDLWQRAKYREVHCGHLHHLSQTEIKGVRVIFLPSLAAKDSWHNEQMYESVREAQRFVWHDNFGKINTSYCRPGFLE